MAEETRAAWVLGLAYSVSERESLSKEVDLLQDCLSAIIKLERAGGLKFKDQAHKGPLGEFRKALASLAVFRTKEKEKMAAARKVVERTQNQLRIQGYDIDKKKK